MGHPATGNDATGEGNDGGRLEATARELGVSDRVTFRGRVSAEALAGAYSECALFVMPSEAEGFGIVYLEAALFGKPSIAGNHGGPPEVVDDGKTGRLVLHDDLAGLTRALVAMPDDRDELRAMGERAKQRLDERFTYASFKATLDDLLAR